MCFVFDDVDDDHSMSNPVFILSKFHFFRSVYVHTVSVFMPASISQSIQYIQKEVCKDFCLVFLLFIF